MYRGIFIFLFLGILSLLVHLNECYAQKETRTKTTSGVYVDKQGVLRWQDTNKEATFFGVNYTTPFAYGYRSHKALQKQLWCAAVDAPR